MSCVSDHVRDIASFSTPDHGGWPPVDHPVPHLTIGVVLGSPGRMTSPRTDGICVSRSERVLTVFPHLLVVIGDIKCISTDGSNDAVCHRYNDGNVTPKRRQSSGTLSNRISSEYF